MCIIFFVNLTNGWEYSSDRWLPTLTIGRGGGRQGGWFRISLEPLRLILWDKETLFYFIDYRFRVTYFILLFWSSFLCFHQSPENSEFHSSIDYISSLCRRNVHLLSFSNVSVSRGNELCLCAVLVCCACVLCWYATSMCWRIASPLSSILSSTRSASLSATLSAYKSWQVL